MKNKKKKSSGGNTTKDWRKNWHQVKCANCANPVKVPFDIPRVLCSLCIIQDPLNGFSALGGKVLKHFGMAKEYLKLMHESNSHVSGNDQTSAKQGGSVRHRTFGSWIKEHKGEL